MIRFSSESWPEWLRNCLWCTSRLGIAPQDCLYSTLRRSPRHPALGEKRLSDLQEISRSRLRTLPKKIRAAADTIDTLNKSIFAPANEIRLAPYNVERKFEREHMIMRYETLPGVLKVYALHLERFLKPAARLVKRLTLGQMDAVRLIRYIEDHTGSPHHEDISNLLEAGWRVAGRTESTPRFLSTEGLSKLYQRWAGAVCKPKPSP